MKERGKMLSQNSQKPIRANTVQNQEKKPRKEKTQKPKEKLNLTSNDRYYKDLQIDQEVFQKNNYKVVRELGRGGYGVVYKAASCNTQTLDQKKKYAIKVNFSTVSPELIFAEIAYLKLVYQKENMPQMVNLFLTDQKIYIVLEYFPYKPFITYFAQFNMDQIKHYLYELLKSLLVLKQNGIFHRDVKPGNFLYNPKTQKGILIDFGLSEIDKKFVEKLVEKDKELSKQVIQFLKPKLQNNSMQVNDELQELKRRINLYNEIQKTIDQIGHNKIGTESFMPLESILHYQEQSYEVDMWAVGVIFLQFLTKKYNLFSNVRMINKPQVQKNLFFVNFILELASLFGAENVRQICNKFGYHVKLPSVVAQRGVNWKEIITMPGFDDDAENLLTKLLCLDPQKRIPVEEAIAHPFFACFQQPQQLQQQSFIQQINETDQFIKQ